jgi:hypothetical protein
MRSILATVVLVLSAVVSLPGTAQAGGPTSVIVTQPGEAAGALYYDDAAYDSLLGLLPDGETRGRPEPPAGAGASYTLTWLIHDVDPWRFDQVKVAPDGTAWVSTTFTAGAVGGWEPLGQAKEVASILGAVLTDGGEPPVVVTAAPEAAPASPTDAGEDSGTTWFSLTGWRWAVPGGLLGVVLGAALAGSAARRSRLEGPRQVLVSSEA